MKKLVKRLIRLGSSMRNPAQPLVTITLSRSALHHNLRKFQDQTTSHQIAPVLKSNAYGHGLNLVALELEKEKHPFFVVDSYFEAKVLKNDGIRTPILIIGYSTIESILKNGLKNISFTITNLETLVKLSEEIKKSVNIQIKIDTGMNRQGVLIGDIKEAVKLIKLNKKIRLEGICSHLADADSQDKRFTEKQIEIWNTAVNYFKDQFPTLKYWHISATAGHIHKNVKANLTRLGIGLYGLTNINSLDLKPVLEMKTMITGIKNIKKGETVGYNNTFIAKSDMKISTIPVGYNEGVDRRLSNTGHVKIGQNFCKIIGRVSMNITIIDVSHIKNITIGDEVVVFSKNKEDENSIENVARVCNTISYEIAVHIPQHLRRILK